MNFSRFFLLTACLSVSTLFAQSQPTETDAPRDGAYDEVSFEERGFIPYDHIREADVAWRRRVWRVVDVREKMNLQFNYPKAPFINILRDLAIEGAITVYDPIDDEFTVPYTTSEAQELGVGKPDTIVVQDPVTLEEKTVVTQSDFNPDNVKKYRLKEDWIFDEETSTLVCRIIGIAPVMEVIDADGNNRGDQVLFWTYYPELRQYLAKEEVFNTKNDQGALSWEDLFEMRFFSSYVIKESNVYDRRIQDYTSGIDALLESDRIKQDIFEWEHDLWSF